MNMRTCEVAQIGDETRRNQIGVPNEVSMRWVVHLLIRDNLYYSNVSDFNFHDLIHKFMGEFRFMMFGAY